MGLLWLARRVPMTTDDDFEQTLLFVVQRWVCWKEKRKRVFVLLFYIYVLARIFNVHTSCVIYSFRRLGPFERLYISVYCFVGKKILFLLFETETYSICIENVSAHDGDTLVLSSHHCFFRFLVWGGIEIISILFIDIGRWLQYFLSINFRSKNAFNF